MTKQIEDGGPAFPQANDDYVDHPVHGRILLSHLDRSPEPGMSLRDYFAGQALAGDLANSSEGCFSNNAETDALQSRAKFFYRMADAMLRARKEDAS